MMQSGKWLWTKGLKKVRGAKSPIRAWSPTPVVPSPRTSPHRVQRGQSQPKMTRRKCSSISDATFDLCVPASMGSRLVEERGEDALLDMQERHAYMPNIVACSTRFEMEEPHRSSPKAAFDRRLFGSMNLCQREGHVECSDWDMQERHAFNPSTPVRTTSFELQDLLELQPSSWLDSRSSHTQDVGDMFDWLDRRIAVGANKISPESWNPDASQALFDSDSDSEYDFATPGSRRGIAARFDVPGGQRTKRGVPPCVQLERAQGSRNLSHAERQRPASASGPRWSSEGSRPASSASSSSASTRPTTIPPFVFTRQAW
mmetsp:Transcript_34597/g.91290  ORF Transcript_34597/g.91290 Transcript_34597/m.91290 type:complete len:316 (+) Transcript_34597:63-1010(+)|eukprot:CAMPEP_0115465520 /NCGR_PEP_ID=MMETSP0271-20121206/49443_1 /TAXON_ID=71861 /ORGANISM="Scrippsiella trochoidea, Strain CCMP3099" /LENGTH=315 /DNA_ID=CAMNT_0002892463 /DNA_START=27 /DNA_END=974 /DNA_ORIENTATION=-